MSEPRVEIVDRLHANRGAIEQIVCLRRQIWPKAGCDVSAETTGHLQAWLDYDGPDAHAPQYFVVREGGASGASGGGGSGGTSGGTSGGGGPVIDFLPDRRAWAFRMMCSPDRDVDGRLPQEVVAEFLRDAHRNDVAAARGWWFEDPPTPLMSPRSANAFGPYIAPLQGFQRAEIGPAMPGKSGYYETRVRVYHAGNQHPLPLLYDLKEVDGGRWRIARGREW